MSEIQHPAPATRAFWRRLWQRVAPPLVVSLFYYGILVYPVLRIWTLLEPGLPGTPTLLTIMVGPIAGRLAYELVPGTFTRWLSALSLTWLGTCFIAFMLVLGYELAHLLVPLDNFSWGVMLLVCLGGLTGYGWLNAQRLQVAEVPVALPADLPPLQQLAGMRIAQISDVHVGSRSGRFLTRVVRRVNQEAPDCVLITGDLIDFRDVQTDEIRALEQLAAPAYFIIGNHERYVDLEAICDRLTSLGIHVLRNETLRVGDLQLIGIDDAEPKNQVRTVLQTLSPDPDAYRVLLYHRPDGAEDAARWGAHLMLTGHTHNGQIVPFNFVVRRIFPRIRGLYRIAGLTLYVSPGTGTWGPILRLGSRCEISMMRLTPDPSRGAATTETTHG